VQVKIFGRKFPDLRLQNFFIFAPFSRRLTHKPKFPSLTFQRTHTMSKTKVTKVKTGSVPVPAKKGGDGGRITKPSAKVEKSKAVAKAAVAAAATKKGLVKPVKVQPFAVVLIPSQEEKKGKKKAVDEGSDEDIESSEDTENSSEEEEDSSEEDEDSDSDSDSDEEEAKPAAKPVIKAVAKAESSDEDEDSDEVQTILFERG
jgi:stringent starvation protein B